MKRILIVDDDIAILEALDLLLRDAGYAVETVLKNGKHVDEKLDHELPDLIILDVLLSGHDGREICRKLKNQPRTGHIPIIMLSAHPTARDTALQAGAEEFISKPFDIDDLLSKVEHHLGH